jgi:hypothetical protein
MQCAAFARLGLAFERSTFAWFPWVLPATACSLTGPLADALSTVSPGRTLATGVFVSTHVSLRVAARDSFADCLPEQD